MVWDSPPPRKTALLTGATGDLGSAVAADLARSGWSLIVHGRDQQRLDKLALNLRRTARKDTTVTPLVADFDSLDAVRTFADQVLELDQQVDVLVNNAAVGFGAPGAPREITADGFERRWAVNYLAPVGLTAAIGPVLKPGARIVMVGSVGQELVDLGDLDMKQGYDGVLAYRRSKLALAAHCIDQAERVDPDRARYLCIHPASLMPTRMIRESGVTPLSSVDEGREALVYAVTDPRIDSLPTGSFVIGTRPGRPHDQALDAEFRAKLRHITESQLHRFGLRVALR